MTKRNFITLILSTLGVLIFSLGMCMCLISEWNTFDAGVKMTIVGVVILLIMVIFRVRTSTKKFQLPNFKSIVIFLLGLIGALTLGVGMCMTMVWDGMMIQGIIIGIFGIVLLLCLIPVCKGGIK